MTVNKAFLIVILLFCRLMVPAMATATENSPMATEENLAAPYQIHKIYTGTDLLIVQFKQGSLSHFSYIITSAGKAMVVDPGRDVSAYLDYVEKEQFEWVGTLLTHSHADFVAGHREMAVATGAPIYASHLSGALFPHIEVKEDDIIKIGKAQVRIIETPGHTVDSICAIVGPDTQPEHPEFVLSGDTLLVGGFGRPDLIAGNTPAAELAAMMFESWTSLAVIPSETVVLPAHGDGSPATSIGQEKQANPFLKFMGNRSAFIASFLSGLEPAPGYFKENARMNRNGPEIVDWKNTSGKRLAEITGLIEQKDIYVVDVREIASYSEEHIPRSVNIPLSDNFEAKTATVVPVKSYLILTGNPIELDHAGKRLKRVGYEADSFVFADYVASAGVTVSSRFVSPASLSQQINGGMAPVILEISNSAGNSQKMLGETILLPISKLEEQARMLLNPEEPLVFICVDEFKSVVQGLLERCGFSKAVSINGDMKGLLQAGLINESAAASLEVKTKPVASSEIAAELPGQITGQELIQLIKNSPETIEIVDIRSAEDFADFSAAGAKNVIADELLKNPAWQTAEKPLIIVDRDGTDAFAVAGLFSRLGKRPVKALAGGVRAYWRASEMGFMRFERAAPSVPVESPKLNINQNQPDTKKNRKGAGC